MHLFQALSFIGRETELLIERDLVRHGTEFHEYIGSRNAVIVDELKDLTYFR